MELIKKEIEENLSKLRIKWYWNRWKVSLPQMMKAVKRFA
jgi:hypothetical protein